MSGARDFRDLDGADPWKLLGVRRDADADEIRRSYRKLSRTTHADVGGNSAEQAKLNRAYEVLSDPVRRSDYLSLLNGPPKPPEQPEPDEPAEDQFEWSSGPYTQQTQTPPRQPGPQYQDPYTAPTYQDPYTAPQYRDPHTAPQYRDPHTAPQYRDPHTAPTYRGPYADPSRSGQKPGVNRFAIAALPTVLICMPISIGLAIRALRTIRRTGERGKMLAWLALLLDALVIAYYLGVFRK
ncbi:DnaJ domain-containing protein [Kribbella sp. GL6]|uniref:DnaJ domain-containing protein n=1 Tax=Kribbella sp. GL6 TaxID=3419765 RepID=UPI003CFC8032